MRQRIRTVRWAAPILASLGIIAAGVISFAAFVPNRAEARAEDHLQEAKALRLAESAARNYLESTTGTGHANTDGSSTAAISVDGRAMGFTEMERVDLRFAPNTRQMVTSISSGISLEAEYNLWVAAWEREGVFNVTTGAHDGTAYVVVVLEDGTGKVLSMSAGVRQPEQQARARGPLPAYEEMFAPVS